MGYDEFDDFHGIGTECLVDGIETYEYDGRILGFDRATDIMAVLRRDPGIMFDSSLAEGREPVRMPNDWPADRFRNAKAHFLADGWITTKLCTMDSRFWADPETRDYFIEGFLFDINEYAS